MCACEAVCARILRLWCYRSYVSIQTVITLHCTRKLTFWQRMLQILLLSSYTAENAVSLAIDYFTCFTNMKSMLDVLAWCAVCSHGRINHCAGCTMGGGPRRQGPPINWHIFITLFDVWTFSVCRLKRNDDDQKRSTTFWGKKSALPEIKRAQVQRKSWLCIYILAAYSYQWHRPQTRQTIFWQSIAYCEISEFVKQLQCRWCSKQPISTDAQLEAYDL